MIELELTADVVGRASYAFSPLHEVCSSLRLLRSPWESPVAGHWVRVVRAGSSSFDAELLAGLVPPPPHHFVPRFFFMTSEDPDVTIHAQLDAVRGIPGSEVLDEVRRAWAPRPLPRVVADKPAATLPAVVADALERYWSFAIAPWWSRIRFLIDEEVRLRTQSVVRRGPYGMLEDLHPTVTLGRDALAVDKPYLAGRSRGTTLRLVPSIFVWPRLGLHAAPDGSFNLFYPARRCGCAWTESGRLPGPDALAALMGAHRAAVLRWLDTPSTTTEIARELNLSPASVSSHLKVLREAGLAESTRKGRAVRYRMTQLGMDLTDGNGVPRTGPDRHSPAADRSER